MYLIERLYRALETGMLEISNTEVFDVFTIFLPLSGQRTISIY